MAGVPVTTLLLADFNLNPFPVIKTIASIKVFNEFCGAF
jgi:hypothetical protein